MESKFEDLEISWRVDATDQQMAQLSAMTSRALRRARLIEGVELTVSAALMIFIIFGIWRKGTIAASLFGGLIVFTLLWSGWSRYRSRRVEWMADGASREAFLGTAVDRMRARAQRTMWSLVLMVPASLLAMFFSATLGNKPGLATRIATGSIGNVLLVGGLASMAATLAYLWLRLKDQQRQLHGLTAIFDNYRRESADDEGSHRRE